MNQKEAISENICHVAFSNKATEMIKLPYIYNMTVLNPVW